MGRKVGLAGRLPDTRSGRGEPAAIHREHTRLAARRYTQHRIRLPPKLAHQGHTRRGKGRGTLGV